MDSDRQKLLDLLRQEVESATSFATWAAIKGFPGGAAIRSGSDALRLYAKAIQDETEDAELRAAIAAVKNFIDDPTSPVNMLASMEAKFAAEVAPAFRRLGTLVQKLRAKNEGAAAVIHSLEDQATAIRLQLGTTDDHRRSSTRKKRRKREPDPNSVSLFGDDE